MPRKTYSQHKRSRKRRRQIIGAALQCFSEFGFANATMEDIRQQSKASNGSIYHHFSSKENLAAAVYLDGLADYQAGFLEELECKTKARAGVRGMVIYHLRWVEKHPEWARFLAQMRHAEFMEDTEGSIAELNRQYLRRVLAWLKPRFRNGELRQMPLDIFFSAVIGPCQEYVRFWLVGQTGTGIPEAGRQLADAAWLAVRGTEGK